MTRTERRVEFFKRVSQFTLQADAGGIRLMPYYFFRTVQEQNELYQKGRTKPGDIVTNSDGITKLSKHQSWLAMDFVIIDDDGKPIWKHNARYEVLGEIWESLGGRWGGRFKRPEVFHFEYGA